MRSRKLELKDPSTPGFFESHNIPILSAILRANRRKGSMIGTYRMFPYSASEAKRPQKIVKGPER